MLIKLITKQNYSLIAYYIFLYHIKGKYIDLGEGKFILKIMILEKLKILFKMPWVINGSFR